MRVEMERQAGKLQAEEKVGLEVEISIPQWGGGGWIRVCIEYDWC